MRMRIAHILAVPLLALTTACSGDDATGIRAESNLSGTFNLQTINGNALPFMVRDDATGRFEVMSGVITLESNGRFTDSMGYQETAVGGVADPFAETLTGRFFHDTDLDAVFFEVDGGGVYEMDVAEDGALVQMVGDYELRYTR